MNFKLIPILSAMLLLACSPKAQTTQTAQNQPAITTNAECKNLHKVTDIDDLLHQMYTNIDSHCLFEMPTAELEKAWGIGVYDYTSSVPDEMWDKMTNERKLLDEKWRKNQQHYLYVLKSKRWDLNNKVFLFQIVTTNSGSIQLGQFPKLLPPPTLIVENTKPIQPQIQTRPSHFKMPSNTVYKPLAKYYWINSAKNKNKPMLITDVNSDGFVHNPEFYNVIYDNFSNLQ